MPRADRETARLHREYLRAVIARTGKRPTPLAKQIGVAPSTLTRLLREPEDSNATMHARTVSMLEEVSKLPFGSGVEPGGPPGMPGFREEAVLFDTKDADPALSAAIKALTAGRKAADPWTIKTKSLERIGFMPGDVVIVDLGVRAQAGNAVCAQVYDVRSGTAETVMRVHEPPYLLAASFDESLRRPLVVDDVQVVIKGVVLPHRLRPGVLLP